MNNKQKFSQITNVLKLIAHPTRFAILNELRNDEACVCHLEAVLGVRQAYLSQQLAALREGNLISDRRDGWNVFYRIVDPAVFKILDAGSEFVFKNKQEILEGIDPVDCPCPRCAGK